jgi:hypothetical protein
LASRVLKILLATSHPWAEEADPDIQDIEHPGQAHADQPPHGDQAQDGKRHGPEDGGAERSLGRKLAVEIGEDAAEDGDQDI